MFNIFKPGKANKKTVKNSKLNMSELFLINEIKQNPDITISKIAKKYNLIYQQVKRVLDRLKEKGVIEVKQNPSNKRENIITIKK
jgi:DNA-binding MarR family transcriptional regulator